MTTTTSTETEIRLERDRMREAALKRRLKTANDNVIRLEKAAPLSRRALQVATAERDRLQLMHSTLQRSIERTAQTLRRKARR